MVDMIKKSVLTAGALGALAFGGSAVASAASNPSSTASTPPANSAPAQHGRDGFPGHGTAAEEAAEKPVTGANADKAKAAAVKAVGSGTAGEVTTDWSGNGYEVTVTKSDGSKVEVHLNGSFGLDDHGRLNG
jgi:hypothetical protein